jgi:glycosyltransferase involved in cell wall biosynthesis
MNNTTRPTVSVVLPVFNAEQFLADTLAALLAQTLTDLEIIAVDDGSTDTSAAILDRLALQHPNRLKVLHTENQGSWRARLLGIAEAQAAWIGFCDADDLPEPALYETLFRRAQQDHAQLAICAFWRFESANGQLSPAEMRQFGTQTLSIAEDPGVILALNTANWNKLFAAELFLGIPDFAQTPRVAEDMLLQLLALRTCERIAFVDTPLYRYRVSAGSAMSTTSSRDIEAFATSVRIVRASLGAAAEKSSYPVDICDLLALTHLGVSIPLRFKPQPNQSFAQAMRRIKELLDADFPLYLANRYTSQAYSRAHDGRNKGLALAQRAYRMHGQTAALQLLRFATRHLGYKIAW